MALQLGGQGTPAGGHLENLVLGDLIAWKDAIVGKSRPEVCYWRTAGGVEVDFVIDTGSSLVPIEVKSTTGPRVSDAKHLQMFRQQYGRKARAGLVLHTGSTLEWLAPGILAAPWWRVM